MAVERLDTDLEALAGEARPEERDLSLPPHSLQAEEAVLGSILKHPPSIVRVSDFLKPEDFYGMRNRHVFRAMLALFTDGKPIDYHSVGDTLYQQGTHEAAGGMLYLSEVNLATPSAAYIEYYGRIVERTSIMRQLIAHAQTIAEIAYRDNLAPEVALEKAEQLIYSISEKRVTRDFRSLEDVLAEYMEQIEALQDGEATRYGIPTGYADLDKLLGGFQRTDLIILAARTSVGKTSFALNLAVNAAVKHNATVAVFSLEMSAEQLASRLLSMESGVDSPRIRSAHLNEQESRKLDAAMNHLAKAPIWVDDTPSIPIMELRSKARRLAAEHTLDMIIVDYLQLVATDGGESRVQEIGQISRALKALARELRVPVVALSQLSRAVEQRTPHIPQLSDLRESGCLVGETRVALPSGELVPIASLVGQTPEVVTLDGLRISTGGASRVWRTGHQPVWKLKTQSGRTIRATGNHKFRTLWGWTALDELRAGSRVAIPRKYPEPAHSIHWDDSRVVLLAHPIGDGCYASRQPIHYTSTSQANLNVVEAAALEDGSTFIRSDGGRPRMEEQRLSHRGMTLARGTSHGGSSHFRFAPSRALLADYARILNAEDLQAIASSDVYWDEITSIELDGEEDVYDMTVPGTHNFVANGMVVHNSLEQDADVVLFIYRDEKYNPDTDKKGVADIIVAKHRNGPTGQVQLLFLERTTKFLDLEVFRS